MTVYTKAGKKSRGEGQEVVWDSSTYPQERCLTAFVGMIKSVVHHYRTLYQIPNFLYYILTVLRYALPCLPSRY